MDSVSLLENKQLNQIPVFLNTTISYSDSFIAKFGTENELKLRYDVRLVFFSTIYFVSVCEYSHSPWLHLNVSYYLDIDLMVCSIVPQCMINLD